MSTRATNTTLLLLMLAQFVSGVGGYLNGAPSGQWVIRLHAVGGFATVVMLFWKGWVIVRSFRRHGMGWRAVPSLALLGGLLLTLLSGLLWSSVGFPAIAGYSGMTVHAGAAVGVLLLLAPHVRLKWKRPSVRDLTGRRLLLRRGMVVAAGGAAWLASEGAMRALGLSGAARRFTGSRRVASREPNGFPATSWLFDAPDPLDIAQWRLRVTGAVEQPLTLSAADLSREDELAAVIDCTGGWYAERRWQGVRIGRLLEEAGVQARARSVVVRATTGYWRRLSLREADEALVATAVDGEPLTHGHGRPARLVAPGRRGYEWVKWVTEIEVSSTPPLLKWPLPLR